MMLKRRYLHTYLTFHYEILPKVPVYGRSKKYIYKERNETQKKNWKDK